MIDENITIKVSGRSVYLAVKQYLDNSEMMQNHIKTEVEKYLSAVIKNRTEAMLGNYESIVKMHLSNELDRIIKKEVETKVASYISSGIKKMFENP